MCCNPLHHLLMPMGCGMDHSMEHEQSQTHTESALEILKSATCGAKSTKSNSRR